MAKVYDGEPLDMTQLSAMETNRLRAQRDRLIEDRARFPDRPDDIGNMISAHIGNLKAAIESADKHADQCRRRMDRAERQRDKMREALEMVLAVTYGGESSSKQGTCPVYKHARAVLAEMEDGV